MTIKEPTRTIVLVGRCWLSREALFAWFLTKFSSKWDVELLLLSRLGRRPESAWCLFSKARKIQKKNSLPIKIMTIKEPTRTIVSVGRCWLSREAPSAWFLTKFLSKWDVELLLLSRLGRRPESAWCPSRLGTNNWWWLWSSEPPLLSNFSWSFWKKNQNYIYQVL